LLICASQENQRLPSYPRFRAASNPFRIRLPFPPADGIVRDMRKAPAILATMFLVAASLFAADVTGTWNATVDLGGQSYTPNFVLKQDGEKLTGTYNGALGEAPLHGTIKGNDVTFDFEGQGVGAVHYAGKLAADGKSMKGTCDYGGQASGTFTATKGEPAKDKK
jgi:hypothetical protein